MLTLTNGFFFAHIVGTKNALFVSSFFGRKDALFNCEGPEIFIELLTQPLEELLGTPTVNEEKTNREHPRNTNLFVGRYNSGASAADIL